jgi:hypothetical protein
MPFATRFRSMLAQGFSVNTVLVRSALIERLGGRAGVVFVGG